MWEGYGAARPGVILHEITWSGLQHEGLGVGVGLVVLGGSSVGLWVVWFVQPIPGTLVALGGPLSAHPFPCSLFPGLLLLMFLLVLVKEVSSSCIVNSWIVLINLTLWMLCVHGGGD